MASKKSKPCFNWKQVVGIDAEYVSSRKSPGSPRILSMLRHPLQERRLTQQNAFAATWEATGIPGTVEVPEIADGIGVALAADSVQLAHVAAELGPNYRRGFNAICAARK